MAIRITCPGCETSLTLSEDKRGRKVRCRACEKVLSIPAINGKASKHAEADEDEEEAQDEPRVKTKATQPDDDSGDEETERPAKKKKKKKKPGGFPIVLVASLAVVLLLLVGGGALLTYFLTRTPEQAKGQPPPQQEALPPAPRIDVPRNPKGLPGNVRARIERTRLDNELNQIKLFFVQYDLNATNPNARTLDGFLKFIERDSKPIHDSIKEKFYTINVKARLDTDSIIACETEPYNEGYYCVKSGGTIGFVPAQEAKAVLNLP